MIWMEFGILLRYVGVILILILSHLISVQGREPYSCDFVQKKFNIDLHLDIYWPVSFKLCMMTEKSELYILIPVWMTLIIIQGHNHWRKSETSVLIFLQISQLI